MAGKELCRNALLTYSTTKMVGGFISKLRIADEVPKPFGEDCVRIRSEHMELSRAEPKPIRQAASYCDLPP